MSPLKLYYSPISTPSRAVLMAIQNMNIDVEVILLNLQAGEHRKGEFAAINPRMIVPTIVDDDFVLCESKAILMYLPHKEKGCKSQSYPKCPKMRALVNQRLLFDSVDFYPRVNDVASLVYGPDPIITAQHKANIVKALRTMETFLEGHDYFVGNNVTLADFAFCSSVALLIALGFEIESFPRVAAWFERMKMQKGFDQLQEGAQQAGNSAKEKFKNSFADL